MNQERCTKMVLSPTTIKNHRYSGFLLKCWYTVNAGNNILTIVICGKRGSGKSWVMLLLAWLLDRNADDKSFFSVDKISFKASEFLQWLNAPKKEWRNGSVICLDDAGLHLYNRDSLTNFIKIINKTLQNIRYKRPIVILTLPSFQMLDKHARDMTDIYIEIKGRDVQKGDNLCKVQELEVAPFDGNMIRYNIMGAQKNFHPILSIPIKTKIPIQYRMEAPPKWVVDKYEEKKRMYLDAYNAANIKALMREEKRMQGISDKQQKMNFPTAVEYCKKRIDKYLGPKKTIDFAKIMMEVDKDDRQLFGFDQAKSIARVLNSSREDIDALMS